MSIEFIKVTLDTHKVNQGRPHRGQGVNVPPPHGFKKREKLEDFGLFPV